MVKQFQGIDDHERRIAESVDDTIPVSKNIKFYLISSHATFVGF